MSDDTKKAAPAAAKAEILNASVDAGILSEQDIADLRAKAKASVQKEIRLAAIKTQLEEFEREERIAAGIAGKPEPVAKGRWPEFGPPPCAEEDKVAVTINLPPMADSIPFDGVLRFDGHTYWVSPSAAASLIDQMQMSWEHQDRSGVQSKNDKYRQRTRGRDAHLQMGVVKPTPGSLN